MNALYVAGLVPNVSFETRISNHFTFNVDLVASLWESIRDRPYMLGQVIPELRYYPKQSFQGFYVGAYAAADIYKVSKWDHPSTDVQRGGGISLGATIGYELPIGGRWLMDFYLGGGWHLGRYYGINTETNQQYAPWNASGEWIPYKAGVSFAFRL